MLIAIFAERSGLNASPFGFLIWIRLYCVDDLAFVNKDKTENPPLHALKTTSKDSTTVNLRSIQTLFMENWKAISIYLFFKKIS